MQDSRGIVYTSSITSKCLFSNATLRYFALLLWQDSFMPVRSSLTGHHLDIVRSYLTQEDMTVNCFPLAECRDHALISRAT